MGIESDKPIGVFDSGAGGLTVVRTLLRRLPGERVIYFGDTGYVPHGPRPPDEIRRFAVDACRFLLAHDVKLIVMGCNMSSAMALDEARAASDCPVLGTIDAGARAAVAATATGRIGVAATEGTVRSGAYERAIKALQPDAQVFQQPCPLLVPAVEAGVQNGLLTDAVAQSLEPLRACEPDTVVLGCTHYPLVRGEFQTFLGEEVRLVDPAEVLAEQAAEELRVRGTASRSGVGSPESRGTSQACGQDVRAPGPGVVECHASGPADSLRTWALRVLGIELGGVEEIDIHRG